MANKVNISHSITKLGTNTYRINITVGRVSRASWNEWGIRCMAYIGGVGHNLGSFKLPNGTTTITQSNYSYDFTISKNTEVYAAYECSHCNGTGSNLGWWGRTSSTTVTYTNPINSIQTPAIRCLNYAAPGRYVIAEDQKLHAQLTTVPQANSSPIRYVIFAQYKNSSGTWVSAGDGNNCILYSTNTNTAVQDLSPLNLPRNTQLRIWGKAEDASTSSALTGTIENIYTNRAPYAPAITCRNSQFAGRYVVEDIIKIDLTTISTDPDGILCGNYHKGQYYDTKTSKWVDIPNIPSEVTSYTVNITGYDRGTRFKFWVVGHDNFGALTNGNTIDNIYRNQKPNKIEKFTAPENKKITSDTINLAWTYNGDPDTGQTISYKLEYSVNGGAYQTISTNVTSCSYNFSINSYAAATRFKFRVTPYDGMVYGDSTESTIYQKDFSNDITWKFPISDSTVYQTNPRCCIQAPTGNYILYVSFDGGTNYINSLASPAKFNIKKDKSITTYLFRAESLKSGGNVIKYYLKSNDTSIDSDIYFVNIATSTINFTGSYGTNNNVQSGHFNTLSNAVDTSRRAYNFSTISMPQATSNETKIMAANLNLLVNYVNEIRNMINGYATTITVNKTSYSVPISNKITKTEFDTIKNEISNL